MTQYNKNCNSYFRMRLDIQKNCDFSLTPFENINRVCVVSFDTIGVTNATRGEDGEVVNLKIEM